MKSLRRTCTGLLISTSLVTSSHASLVSDSLASTLVQAPHYTQSILYNQDMAPYVDDSTIAQIKQQAQAGNTARVSQQLEQVLYPNLSIHTLQTHLAPYGLTVHATPAASATQALAGKYIGSETTGQMAQPVPSRAVARTVFDPLQGPSVSASAPPSIVSSTVSSVPSTASTTSPASNAATSPVKRPPVSRTSKKSSGGNGWLYAGGGLALLAGLGAAAAGGGGGGGGDSSGSDSSANTPNNNGSSYSSSSGNWSDPRTNYYSNTQNPNDFITAEFTGALHNVLGQVGAHHAYAKGLTGEGVTIGVVDWFDVNAVSYSYLTNNIDPSSNPGGNLSHGNIVATYAAAPADGVNVQGIAPDASLQLQYINANGSFSNSLMQILNSVDVLNTSCQCSLTNVALQAIGNSNTVVTAAAGNYASGTNIFNPSNPFYSAPAANPVNPAALVDTVEVSGNMIAVGTASNVGGTWQSTSYQAGNAQNFYLVVPAHLTQTSSLHTDGQNYVTYHYPATSFAAPIVAGAAALIREGWPGLSAEDVVQVLLLSADDIGAVGVDAVFGHGMLNVENALLPIGATSIPSASPQGQRSAVENSNVMLSSAFGDALENSHVPLGFVDQFDRAYQVDIKHFVDAKPQVETIDAQFAAFGEDQKWVEQSLGDSIHLAYQAGTETASIAQGSDVMGTRKALGFNDKTDHSAKYRVSLSFDALGNTGLHAAQSGNAQEALAWAQGDVANAKDSLISKHSMAMPYLSVQDTDTAYGAGATHRVNDQLALGVSTVFTQDEDGAEDTMLGLVRAEYQPTERLKFRAHQGLLLEKNTFLGSQTAGAFNTKDGVRTLFVGGEAEIEVSGQLSFHAHASLGRTSVDPDKHSIFTDVSDITTSAYGVGMRASDVLRAGDQLNLAIERPLKVVDGQAEGQVVTGNQADHSYQTARFNTDLTPSKSSVKIGASYHTDLTPKSSLSVGSQYIINPNHTDTKDDFSVMMKYKKRF